MIRPTIIHHREPSSGFTLIELIMYVAITSILVSLITLFLASLHEARIKSETVAEVEQQGLQVLQRMTHAIRNAQTITSPSAGSSGSSLTLDVVAATGDPTVFDESSGAVRITEGAGSAIPLTNDYVTVSALTFSNRTVAVTPGLVQITFTVSRLNMAGRNEYAYTRTFGTSVSLR
ncbi:MAG: prepilin-type N-terminal cleavage/methylation domain-containing protein, partial [Patescibacteria group bacterium]